MELGTASHTCESSGLYSMDAPTHGHHLPMDNTTSDCFLGMHQFILFLWASPCPQHCAEMGLNAQGLPRVVDTYAESNGSLLHSGSMCMVQGSSRPSRGRFSL